MTRQRQFHDPNKLTEYEQRILELRQKGLTWHQVAAALNQKMESVRSRYPVIKDKLLHQGIKHD